MAESRICVVAYDASSRPDAVLRDVVARLQATGVRPAGLVQEMQPDSPTHCATLTLQDIGTGRRIQAFEQRGLDTRGCRLDPSGLATAAAWLRQAIEEQPDILFVNRFGRQEAAGRGLVEEIALAVTTEIPIVIAVNKTLLPAWQAFAGPDSIHLALDAERITEWCLRQREGLGARP